MAKYVVQYEMRKGSGSASYSKTFECETESTAIQIAEAQGRKDKPGYDFNLKKMEKNNMKLPYFKLKDAFNEARDSFSYGSGTDKLAATANC